LPTPTEFLYGQRDTQARRGIAEFATVTFPSAIRSIRWFILVATLLTAVPWAVFQVWLAISPRAFSVVAPAAVTDQYIHRDFESYYSSQPAQNFASQVFFNNIRVAFLAFAAGILLCVVTAALLAYNGANGGKAGGLFTNVGESGKFWGLILPHGMLELRFAALTEESRRSGTILVGLIVAFLLAAGIEGFVTGRPWPTALRVGIGAVAFIGFWGWTYVFARHASAVPCAPVSRFTAGPTP
jgi:uncharacterized membrane protein SpoIIM required for sporulation